MADTTNSGIFVHAKLENDDFMNKNERAPSLELLNGVSQLVLYRFS